MSMRSHYCGLVTEALIGQTVSLCGWVNRRRDHGGVIFVDLRDREGYVQVVCDPDRPEMFKIAEDLRGEFCIRVLGLVRARPEGTSNDSMKLARNLLTEIGGINRLHKSHVEQAGFAVLKAPDIPSILVETAFISNPQEEKKLLDDDYQLKMAQALGKGIRKYLGKHPAAAGTKIALR